MTMAMMRRSFFVFIVLRVMCICMFLGMAMATGPQELSSPPPSSPSTIHKSMQTKPMSPKQREKQVKQILDAAGYKSLSKLVVELLMQRMIVNGSSPLTLFAPSDEAFKEFVFESIDASRILGYHTVKGLFSSTDLAALPVGTKLHTILPGNFLDVTVSPAETNEYPTAIRAAWIEGVEISHPDVFNDGQFLAIHGIDTFLNAEEDSASVKALQEKQERTRRTTYRMEEAMITLRDRGYSVLAVILRLSPSILGLDNVTIFWPDDNSIFLNQHEDFLNFVAYHVVPNRLLLNADLLRLPRGTKIETLMGQDSSSSLLVTTNSSSSNSNSGKEEEVSINYMGIKNPDVFSNAFIAVHGIRHAFPQLFATSVSASLPSITRLQL